MMRRRTLGAAALSAAGAALAVYGLGGLPATAAQKTTPTSLTTQSATSGVFFNNPKTDADALDEHLATLIEDAPAGSEIHASVYQLATDRVANELIAASERGVEVRVVADGVNSEYASYKKLETAIGKDKTKPSWTMKCTAGKACIGTEGTPINHNKFYLFSSTQGAANVVVQSTANQSSTIGGTGGWNSSYAVAGNTSLYGEYRSYFDDLAAMRKTNDYYNVRPPTTHGIVKAYFHPRATRDTIVDALDYVSCFGSTQGGTSDNHRTIIRVSMWRINRPAVAKKLWELDSKGCYVDIVATEIYPSSLKELTKPAGKYHGPEIHQFKGSKGTHEKNMLIDGVYNGTINQKLTYTGTHNFTPSSLRENDETTLRIDDDGVHDLFRQNFWDIRAAADASAKAGAAVSPRAFPAEDGEPS